MKIARDISVIVIAVCLFILTAAVAEDRIGEARDAISGETQDWDNGYMHGYYHGHSDGSQGIAHPDWLEDLR